MQKILFLCLVGLLVLLPYELQYGRGGYLDLAHIQKQIKTQATQNDKLSNRNSMEQLKIEALKGSIDSIEARARYELNLIKPGETLVVLPGNYGVKVPLKKNKK